MKTLCIYHGNCADGFTAAWVVWKALGESVEFHAGVYQDPPPDVTGRDVIMVDFSYKRAVIEAMLPKVRSLKIFDHHKTAEADLRDVGADIVVFDMERSGAGITWDHFFPRVPRPALIDHVEDRDLWRFKLPKTREIQAAVFSFAYDFATWERIMGLPTDVLARDGEAIERKHFKDIEELLKVVTRRMKIGGYEVPAANLPYTLTSDAGHKLAQGEPFAACYWDTPDGRVFSLRSTDNGMDVSSVAKAYGGGGHRNASGFRVPHERVAPDGGPGAPS